MGENSTGGKSAVIRSSGNIFESSRRDKSEYFVDVVKDKRTKNNILEFLIGWCDFPDTVHDTWDPLVHLSGSEHMIREFNQKWEEDYVRKTVETLQVQADRRTSSRRKVNDSDGDSNHRSGLDELLGISTTSIDFDVSSVEGEIRGETHLQASSDVVEEASVRVFLGLHGPKRGKKFIPFFFANPFPIFCCTG